MQVAGSLKSLYTLGVHLSAKLELSQQQLKFTMDSLVDKSSQYLLQQGKQCVRACVRACVCMI